MEIKSFASGVNRIVTNETTLSIGTNALATTQTENGSEQSIMKSSGAPDQYSVTMYFSNSTNDSFYHNHTDSNGNHITEWQAFINWFKYDIGFGTIPFYFASLFDVTGETSSVYKIISNGLPKGTPNGEYMKCTMTWQEVFIKPITYTESSAEGDYLDITNGQIEYHFTEVPETSPKRTLFTMTFNEEEKVVERIDYDGYKTCVLYFQSIPISESEEQTFTVSVSFNGLTAITGTLIVAKGENNA